MSAKNLNIRMQALGDILRKENRTHLLLSQLEDTTCIYYAEGNADVLQKMLSQLFKDRPEIRAAARAAIVATAKQHSKPLAMNIENSIDSLERLDR